MTFLITFIVGMVVNYLPKGELVPALLLYLILFGERQRGTESDQRSSSWYPVLSGSQ